MAPNKSRFSICATKVFAGGGVDLRYPAAMSARPSRAIAAPPESRLVPTGTSNTASIAPGNLRRIPVRTSAAAGCRRPEKSPTASSMRTLARSTYLRRRCRTAPASSSGNTASNSSAVVRAPRATRSRGPAGCESRRAWWHRARAFRCRPRAGPGETARHRRRGTPARRTRRTLERSMPGSAHLCFCRGFIWSERPILAEFAPVPNAPSDVAPVLPQPSPTPTRRRRSPGASPPR